MPIPSYINILSIRPYIQRLTSYRPNNDTSDPNPLFELIVRRHFYIKEVSLNGVVSRPSFVGRHRRSISFLVHDQLETAVHAVLSFPGYDLYPACGPEILSFVRETMDGGKLKVVADISYMTEYQINFDDEELAIALAEASSEEEERSRKRRKVAPAETVLEEREWEGGDGEGSACSMCTICLEEFGVREKVVRMPCSHCFHKECIRKWLTEESNSCPLCRFEIE